MARTERPFRGPSSWQRMQAGEVEPGIVHYSEGVRFRCDDVQDLDIVKFSFGDLEAGDELPRGSRSVQLDGSPGLSETCPSKEGQAKANRGARG